LWGGHAAIEKGLCLSQVGRVESLGKPVKAIGEQTERLGRAPLFLAEATQLGAKGNRPTTVLDRRYRGESD